MAYTRYARKPAGSYRRYIDASPARPVTIQPAAWVANASPQQRAIWDAILRTEKHIMVRALAGTGKTSTMVEAIRLLVERFPELRIRFVAFNKSIADYAKTQLPASVASSTLHSFGMSLIREVFPKVKVNKDRVYWGLDPAIDSADRNIIVRIVDLCRANLIDGTNRDELLDLCADHAIEFKDEKANVILNAVPTAIQNCADMDEKNPVIDFMDMIWLPTQLKAVRERVSAGRLDVLIVDEAQDMNPAQQLFARLVSDRLMFVGDPNQAIYGFMGADIESMDNLAAVLENTERGVTILPLTVTRRCPQIVVALARQDVPEFEAAPEAPIGTLCFGHSYAVLDPESETGYRLVPKPDDAGDEPVAEIGDLVLCRTNAPLITVSYSLIKLRIPVRIKGKEFGDGLVAWVKKLDVDGTVTGLLEKQADYVVIEANNIAAKSRGRAAESKLQALQDKADCIEALCDGMVNVADVIAQIEMLFNDETRNPDKCVTCSTIHKAKGLEAKTVRVIMPELTPHPMAKTPQQLGQEYHLRYVGRTRAMDTLHFH